MTRKDADLIAQNPDKQYFVKPGMLAKILGFTRGHTNLVVQHLNIPFYRPYKDKVYFLPEVTEAINGTKWQEGTR